MLFLLKPEIDTFSTYVKTDKREYFIKGIKCTEFISNICNLCGGTMEGKRKAICKKLHIVQKAPILVSERFLILLFPIKDYSGVEYWINYRGIKRIKKHPNKQCTIIFQDQSSIKISIDYRTILRQLNRCELYLELLFKGEAELEAYIDNEVM